MTLDWDIYSDEIDKQIDSEKEIIQEALYDSIQRHINEQVYFSLKNMIPLVDRGRDDFTLRLSYDCAYNRNDDRNILFSLSQYLDDADYIDLLDRMYL